MNRLRLISIVLAVIVLGSLAFAIRCAREPRYEERTLSDWIDSTLPKPKVPNYNNWAYNLTHFQPDNSPAWHAASNAIHEIGPRAVPFLLKWSRAKDSSLKSKLIVWWNKHFKHSAFHPKPMPAEYYHNLAISGFMMLGQQSISAWPVLIKSTADPDWEQRYLAMRCLTASRPDKSTLLPVLLRLTLDPDSRVQSSAAFWIHRLFPKDAEAQGINILFPELKDVPTEPFISNQIQVK